MSLSTIYIAPDFDVLAAASTGQYFGICSATAQSITVKTVPGGTGKTFNMVAGKDYLIQVAEVTTYAGAAGDLIGYKVKA